MIDSHCHLAGEEFVPDLEAVIARAKDAGLTTALCILAAGDQAEAARAERVRALWPTARFATGIHPHQAGQHAADVPAGIEAVRRRVAADGACAIGEIGLDYHYDFSPRDVQQDVFRGQVQLAREQSLPIVIHTRDATEDTFAILAEAGNGDVRGVFHCFTGDEAMARRAVAIGFHVSFAGIVTFPRADSVREAARFVPADRLLAETDSPYLAPVPHRGKRNEPAYVARVIEALAQIRGEPAGDVARQMTRNFTALFG